MGALDEAARSAISTIPVHDTITTAATPSLPSAWQLDQMQAVKVQARNEAARVRPDAPPFCGSKQPMPCATTNG